jgi:hypothetical protein
MEQKRSVRLVLRTSDLSFDDSTKYGFCDEFRTDFTWYNINLRFLLSDLYDQCDFFNMPLISVSLSRCNALDASTATDDDYENRNVLIKISGLPFINQTYDTLTKNNGTFVTVAPLNIPTTAITTNQFYNNSANVITFNKSQDLCNFYIALFRVLDDTKPSLDADTANPNFVFIFVITGIDKPDNPDRKNHLMKIN